MQNRTVRIKGETGMALTIIVAVLAVFVAFHMGRKNGIRIGASRTESELMRGATLGLNESEQNELAEQIRQVKKERPASFIRNLDEFVLRTFELGRLVAEANRQAGVVYQQRREDQYRRDQYRP